MTPLPDVKVLADAVREVAKNFPNRFIPRNARCTYVHDFDPANPNCIVGQALVNLGYVTDWREQNPISGETHTINSAPITDLYDIVTDEGLVNVDRETLAWISNVQYEQDRNLPWGQAIKVVDETRKPV